VSTKDDGSGTRTQWMRLAEEAIADAAYWKQEYRTITGRVEKLERAVASLQKDLGE
jgi:hypothetical protein